MKMNPYAIPFNAKPVNTHGLLSGIPSISEGPWRTIEHARSINETRMSTLRGILPVALSTKMQLIV
jgi:hypothetical protein